MNICAVLNSLVGSLIALRAFPTDTADFLANSADTVPLALRPSSAVGSPALAFGSCSATRIAHNCKSPRVSKGDSRTVVFQDIGHSLGRIAVIARNCKKARASAKVIHATFALKDISLGRIT